MQELLPCPFCGAEPEMVQIGQNKIRIKCPECLVEKEQKVLRQTVDWLKGKMVAWWNSRMPTQPTSSQKTTHDDIYDDTNPAYITGNEDGI